MTRTALAAVLVLAVVPAPSRAESTPFVFDRAVYQDEKEVALKAPEGVACDDTGRVVIADTGNGRLVVLRYVGGTMSGGTELRPAGVTYPRRVQLDSKGNVLVLDSKARKIFRVDAKGAVVGTLEPKAGASAMASLPVAFKLDAADNVYVLDGVGGRVVVLDPAGTVVRQVELPKGPSTWMDLHVDAAGTIYVVDGAQAAIFAAEKTASAFKPFGAPLKDKMNFPTYMTGSKGRFFLVDQNGNGVVVLGTDGTFQGRQLAIGWSEGFVYYPAQLCVNGNGDAFVADRGNNRVQVFNTSK